MELRSCCAGMASVAMLVGYLHAADAELEALKAAANESMAVLEVEQTVYRKRGRDVVETRLLIDTGARRYRLRYKTFRGEAARHNPRDLNDWASGYGMIDPHTFWYANGMLIDVRLAGRKESVQVMGLQGKVRPLTTAGSRVVFDLVFSSDAGCVVVRTVALAGREELFISVSGALASAEPASLTTTFCGYPHGFEAPLDRWVHTDGRDLPNAGKDRKTFPLDLEAAPWLLLCDHGKGLEGRQMGLLGLGYDRAELTAATIEHARNYSIRPTFIGPCTSEQRYVAYTFGPMTWQEARRRLSHAGDAGALFRQAFDGLQSPREAD